MRSRLRIWLPLLQVLLAAALITSNLLRTDPLSHPSFTAPDRQFCDALNAPVVLIRGCWLRLASREFPYLYNDLYGGWAGVIIENVVYVILVGFLWYLASIEIVAQEEGRGSIIAEKTGMRTAFDLSLIFFGVCLGIAPMLELHRFVAWHGVFVIPYFVWAVVIVVFYARDLWAHQSPRRRSVNS